MIQDFKRMASGVGGSCTKWQGKPPSHGVYWIDTEEGQTTVTAYDLRGVRFGDRKVRVEDGAMGPKDIPFASERDFSDLSPDLQDAIRERIIEDFEESDFFSE